MKSLLQKSMRVGASSIVMLALLVHSFFFIPQKAHAQWLTFDASSFVQNTISAIQNTFTAGATGVTAVNSSTDILKKYVLQPLAIAAAKAAINAMTQSIVTWINSGFHGSPGFATNLQRNFQQLGDSIAATFVTEIINNTTINSPYIQQAMGVITRGYLLYTSRDAIAERLRYTLNEYSQNEEAFRQGQFNQGGFNAWFAITRNCANDPDCVTYAAQEELVNRIDAETRQRLTELDWGRGFLSWRDCPEGEPNSTDTSAGTGDGSTALSDADNSYKCTVKTPGSILEDAMGITATSPLRQLELAESFDQIIGALASQLVSHVFSATGLLGASEPASGGGRSALENATNAPPSESTLALIAGFEQSVLQEKTQTASNQTAWQTFRPTLVQAKSICDAGGLDAKKAEIANGLTQADAMIAKAPDTIAKLTEILDAIAQLRTQTGANYNAASSALTAQYDNVLQTGRVSAPDPVLKQHADDIVSKGCD